MRLAALFCLLPGLALGDEALPEPWPGNAVGIWAAEPDWCQFATQIGSHDPAPIELTETEFLGLENSCAITEAHGTGIAHSWALRLVCQSEGDSYDDEMMVLMAGPDELYIYRGFAPVRFTRCIVGESG